MCSAKTTKETKRKVKAAGRASGEELQRITAYVSAAIDQVSNIGNDDGCYEEVIAALEAAMAQAETQIEAALKHVSDLAKASVLLADATFDAAGVKYETTE